MPRIGECERKTQNRVIKFFCDELHYTYIGNLHDSDNSNIMQERLHAYLLRKGYSEKLASRAIEKLVKTSKNLQQGLYFANQEVYSLLKYGAKVQEEAGEAEKTVYFIDFENPGDNDFCIAEEVTVVGNNTKRPDVVIYVNGIALAVIELKKSTISVSDGIRQNLTNQKAHFIEQFFTTMQFCMAGNESEGLRYGTLLTPEKHYLEWKQEAFREFADERNETDVLIEEKCKEYSGKLYEGLFCLFYKKRFLDLIHNFVIFDKGIKKVSGDLTTFQYNLAASLAKITHTDGTVSLFTYEDSDDKAMLTAKDSDNYQLSFGYTLKSDGKRVETVTEYGKGTQGQKITFDRTKYNSTKIQTAGTDGVYGNSNDLVTTYQFDNFGKTVTQQLSTDGGVSSVAGVYEYTEREEASLKSSNKVTSAASLGRNVVNHVINGNAEKSSGWSTGVSSATATHAYSSDAAYIGQKSIHAYFLVILYKIILSSFNKTAP